MSSSKNKEFIIIIIIIINDDHGLTLIYFTARSNSVNITYFAFTRPMSGERLQDHWSSGFHFGFQF